MKPEETNSFMNELKLKEAVFLMNQGFDADAQTVTHLLAQILPKTDQKNTLILRFKDALLQVLSGDGASLALPSSSGLAFRGEGATTLYRLDRSLEKHEVSFLLSPNEAQTEVYLAVEINPPAALRAKLKLDGDTIETLYDLSKEKMFDSPITMESSPEVVFLEKNREIGRFHLILANA
jgi:hypothetical protein